VADSTSKIAIIADDQSVYVNGVGYNNLTFSIDSSIHAVQWYGTAGIIEYKEIFDGDKFTKAPNESFTDFSPFQSALDAWNNHVPPIVYIDGVAQIPANAESSTV